MRSADMPNSICQWLGCNEALTSSRAPRKWCETHRLEMKYQSRRTSSNCCNEPECERPATHRGMCKMHYKREYRATVGEPTPWTDLRRSNSQARRARLKGASVTKVTLLSQIIERDGLDCTWCHLPVDLDLQWPHPYSKSIDHTLALVHGGVHALSNTTLMHLRCNSSKGARVTSLHPM